MAAAGVVGVLPGISASGAPLPFISLPSQARLYSFSKTITTVAAATAAGGARGMPVPGMAISSAFLSFTYWWRSFASSNTAILEPCPPRPAASGGGPVAHTWRRRLWRRRGRTPSVPDAVGWYRSYPQIPAFVGIKARSRSRRFDAGAAVGLVLARSFSLRNVRAVEGIHTSATKTVFSIWAGSCLICVSLTDTHSQPLQDRP